MTLPASHLSTEALAALVDGELIPAARTRALAHADKCAECAEAIRDQQEAKRALTAAMAPDLPSGLLAKLSEIPFTTELHHPGDWPDRDIVAHDGRLEVATGPSDRLGAGTQLNRQAEFATSAPMGSAPAFGGGPRFGAVPAFAAALVAPGVASGVVAADPGPAAGVADARARRLRRGLVGAAAGLTIGVLSAAAPQAVAAHGDTEYRPVPGGDVQQVDFVSGVTGERPARESEPAGQTVEVGNLPTR